MVVLLFSCYSGFSELLQLRALFVLLVLFTLKKLNFIHSSSPLILPFLQLDCTHSVKSHLNYPVFCCIVPILISLSKFEKVSLFVYDYCLLCMFVSWMKFSERAIALFAGKLCPVRRNLQAHPLLLSTEEVMGRYKKYLFVCLTIFYLLSWPSANLSLHIHNKYRLGNSNKSRNSCSQ